MTLIQFGRETDAQLDVLRTRGDDLADRAAADLVASGMARGGDLVTALETRAAQGGVCRELLDHAFTVPGWVDFNRMVPGALMGLRHAVQAALALLLGSLVESYASAKGSKVLIRSGQLQQDTLQRLHRTAEFVLFISQARGPRPGSKAHRTILNVRMVHAFVRRATLKRPDWDVAWGHPVNQEDYASTLMLFSHVTLRSLALMGVRVTAEEEDSVHHTFRWVGHVMGVDPLLLTTSRAEEHQLYDCIARRQLHPDADGAALAHALVQAMGGRPPLYLPTSFMYAISRLLVGAPLADAFEFPRSNPWERLTRTISIISRAQRAAENIPGVPAGLAVLGERFATALLNQGFAAPNVTARQST